MSFDIIAYYTLGGALLLVIGFILYLRPPGWKFLSALQTIFVAFAFLGCLTLDSFRSLLTVEAIYLFLATVCFIGLLKSRAKELRAEEVAEVSGKHLRLRFLLLAYLAVVGRLLLNPFLHFAVR